MLFNQLALALCVFLLFGIKAAAVVAARRGDTRQVRVLQFFRLGLGLSACSHVLHFLDAPAASPYRVLSMLCGFFGSVLLWIGCMEHWVLHRERSSVHTAQEKDDGSASEALLGLPCLNSRTQRVLRYAQEEARRQRQSGVDTDHLLLGLLREPGGAGVHILDRLCVKTKNLRLALGQPASPVRRPLPSPFTERSAVMEALPLTGRAHQALSLAAQEAHRFDKASIGTDHLLLGLVLMGTGVAAVLFQEGVTVEGVRSEVLKSRVCR